MNKITLEVELSEETKDFLTALLGGAKAAKGKKPAVEEEAEVETEESLLDEEETYTVERVREKCQQLIQDGKAALLKKLLTKFKAEKVVQLKPAQFEKFMEEANKIK